MANSTYRDFFGYTVGDERELRFAELRSDLLDWGERLEFLLGCLGNYTSKVRERDFTAIVWELHLCMDAIRDIYAEIESLA